MDAEGRRGELGGGVGAVHLFSGGDGGKYNDRTCARTRLIFMLLQQVIDYCVHYLVHF